jgi:hypothetical protein
LLVSITVLLRFEAVLGRLFDQPIDIHSSVVIWHIDLAPINHRRIKLVEKKRDPNFCESHKTFNDPSAARCTGS